LAAVDYAGATVRDEAAALTDYYHRFPPPEKRGPFKMAHIAMKRTLGNGKAYPSERLRRVAKRPIIIW
jgi:hypothetical protein